MQQETDEFDSNAHRFMRYFANNANTMKGQTSLNAARLNCRIPENDYSIIPNCERDLFDSNLLNVFHSFCAELVVK